MIAMMFCGIPFICGVAGGGIELFVWADVPLARREAVTDCVGPGVGVLDEADAASFCSNRLTSP